MARCPPLGTRHSCRSRRKEAQIPSERQRRSEPPYVVSYSLNGLLRQLVGAVEAFGRAGGVGEVRRPGSVDQGGAGGPTHEVARSQDFQVLARRTGDSELDLAPGKAVGPERK